MDGMVETSATEGPTASKKVQDPGDIDPYAAVPIDLLVVVPSRNPRTHSPRAVAGMAKSIEADGLIEPIVIRQGAGRTFEVVIGELRYRACVQLQRPTIACVFKPEMTAAQADAACFASSAHRLTVWECFRYVGTLRVADPKITADEITKRTRFPFVRKMMRIQDRCAPDLIEKLARVDCLDKLFLASSVADGEPKEVRWEAQRIWWTKRPKAGPRKPHSGHIQRTIRIVETTGRLRRTKLTKRQQHAVIYILRWCAGITAGSCPQRGKRYKVSASDTAFATGV